MYGVATDLSAILEQLIPTWGCGSVARLRDQRLQALFGRRKKAIEAFVELELGVMLWMSAGTATIAPILHVPIKLVDRGTEEERDDRDHEHDFEEGESTLILAHKQLATGLLQGLEQVIRFVPEIFQLNLRFPYRRGRSSGACQNNHIICPRLQDRGRHDLLRSDPAGVLELHRLQEGKRQAAIGGIGQIGQDE